MTKLPLPFPRKGNAWAFPEEGRCPVCAMSFKDVKGVAYICGGALPVDETESSIDSQESTRTNPEAFWHIGFHGSDSEAHDSVHAGIGDRIDSDQFEISFCSLGCLRVWFNSVVDELEVDLKAKLAAMERSKKTSYLEELREQFKNGMSRSEILVAMRQREFSVIDAIKAARELFGIGLGEAKRLIEDAPEFRDAVDASFQRTNDIIWLINELEAEGHLSE